MYFKTDMGAEFADLPSNFVRFTRDGFLVAGDSAPLLRGRLTGEPRVLYKLFEDGKLVDSSDDGRAIPGARKFLRVLLIDDKHGELTLDLAPTSARNLIAFCDRVAADGIDPQQRDVKLTMRDRGKWFEVKFDLATGDEARPEAEEGF